MASYPGRPGWSRSDSAPGPDLLVLAATLLSLPTSLDPAVARIGPNTATWADPAAPRLGPCPVLQTATPPRESGTPTLTPAAPLGVSAPPFGSGPAPFGRPRSPGGNLPPRHVLFCTWTT